jgi:hypothetical protein
MANVRRGEGLSMHGMLVSVEWPMVLSWMVLPDC